MAKDKPFKGSATDILSTPIDEVMFHYNLGREDNDTRRTRKNGWNDITDAWWGKLPDDWPYDSRVVDPVLRTSIIEKDARLLNSKLRGRLIPREGGDMLSARINNALLDYQWDNANHGGTMLTKWKAMSQDTRLYASCFAYVCWKHEESEDGEVLFDGNEFIPLDVRDSFLDPNCAHVRDAKWFQLREWAKVEDLEKDAKLYPGLDELKSKLSQKGSGGDRRDNAYENRTLQLKSLQDRVGTDRVFPTVEIVTEYRKDRWITFAPKYKVILRDIDNPYDHHRIPIVQLRYYKLTGDPRGEAEAEPVLSIWRAIQATLNGYLDTMNIHMRPPLKIIDGQVRIETIVFGPEAQWLMDRQDSVLEYQGSAQPMQLFQTTYSSLKSAFASAMGDLSQGVSQIDPFNPDKTATEVKQSAKQQNSRDQDNQNALAEAIQDMMGMWLSNNRQFLFIDPDKQEYILRILGSDLFAYFKKAGLGQMELTPQAMQAVGDIIQGQSGNVSEDDINMMIEAGKTPKFPVFQNPKEKNPAKLQAYPKMRMNESGDGAELSLVPEDLEGNYDYIPDVKSMATGAGETLKQGLISTITTLTQNPVALQLLQAEGVQPKFKDLLVASIEQDGLTDAERFFPVAQKQEAQGQSESSAQPNQQVKGPTESINFKDLPPDGQVQMARQAGINIATPQILTTSPQSGLSSMNGQSQAQGQPTQGNQPIQPVPQQGIPAGAPANPAPIIPSQG